MPIRLETNLLSEGPFKGRPTAIVNEPYEIVGEFFSAELVYLDNCEKFIRRALKATLEAQEHQDTKLADGHGGHELLVENGKAIVTAVYRGDDPMSCTISCNDFHTVLTQWYEFLKSVQK